jgi:transcriptional regulator GlxA family with amidase domain
MKFEGGKIAHEHIYWDEATVLVQTGLLDATGLPVTGAEQAQALPVFDLLPYFGAIPVESRVVVDGNFISAAGVSAGIDGAITIASILRGDGVAQQIQLKMEYVPDPPFDVG